MSSRTTMKGDGYHHGNLRAALLSEARTLLEEEGPAALSLRELARRAGVAAPSVYHHFASLDAIAVALAEAGFAELAARLEGAPTNAKGQLSGVGLAYVRFAMVNPGLYRLMFGDGLAKSSAGSETLHGLRQRAHERVKAGLRKRLPEEDVPTAALFLWSVVHGLALLMIDGQIEPGADPDATVAAVLNLTGTGLPTST